MANDTTDVREIEKQPRQTEANTALCENYMGEHTTAYMSRNEALEWSDLSEQANLWKQRNKL